jgi:uncharacterized protein with GYD domain
MSNMQHGGIDAHIYLLPKLDRPRRQECERGQQTISKSLAEKLDVKVLSAYVTTGQYDVVVTLDMPNGEAMAKFASAISGSGNARTTTVRGYTPDEFSKLAAEAPKL